MEQALSRQANSRPGRPRAFDQDKVLNDAITLFSRKGYSASSVADISQALKLTIGSIYKAFGDKRGLFTAALQRYVEQRYERTSAALRAAPNGRERVRGFLLEYADLSHGEAGRTGCLVVATAVEFGACDPELAQNVALLLEAREKSLRRFIEEGQADGSIGRQIDAQTAARALLCMAQGMRVLGKAGRTRAEMVEVAEQAMRILG